MHTIDTLLISARRSNPFQRTWFSIDWGLRPKRLETWSKIWHFYSLLHLRISNIALLLPKYIIKSGDRTKLLGRFTRVYKIKFQERKGSEVKEHESGEVWCFNFKLDTVRRLWIRRACLPPELLLLLFSSGYEIHGCTICIMLIFHKKQQITAIYSSYLSVLFRCKFYIFSYWLVISLNFQLSNQIWRYRQSQYLLCSYFL